MPPRIITLMIVAGWLASTTWLFCRDLMPLLWPAGVPPFTIDLVDEARATAATRWTVYQDEIERGYAETSVRYNAVDDTFELRGEFKLWNTRRVSVGTADLILRGMFRVTRDGQLREVRGSGELLIAGQVFEGGMHGIVHEDRIALTVKLYRPWTTPEQKLPVMRLAERGSVLNPLQPLNRLRGLRKGQRWQMPLIDPFSELKRFGVLLPERPRVLAAHVLPEARVLDWNNEPVVCLIVEYHGEDTEARTWVRESDGLVIKQEVKLHGDSFTMVRDAGAKPPVR